MLRNVVLACRHGCKYKGEGCVRGPRRPAVVRSQVYQESLERCARANKQEIEEPLLVEAGGRLGELRVPAPRSGNRTSSIARTGGCGA